MATEVAIFKIKEGIKLEDANSDAGKVFKETLNTLTQEKSVQKAYWGYEVENPGTLRLFVDWDSVESHTEFTKQPHFQAFFGKVASFVHLDSAQLFHAHYAPFPPDKALSDGTSPATEILTIYFPSDYSDADQKKFDSDIKQLFKAVEKHADTYTASAGGWIVEELPIPDTSEKGKAYAALIGWHSVEAHLAFRETQAFKDNIHLLRGAKDLKKLQVVHYHGTQVS